VLITGHTGFKGSWLALWLHRLGADVIGYALPSPTDPSLFDAVKISSDIKSYLGDIRDLNYLEQIVTEQQPEIVLHLAAQSLVPYSYAHPLETYTVNVIGTANILEVARKTKCAKVIIIVTSDKCYENREWVWGYRESDPLGGHDPYSSSKGCAEIITAAYRKSYFDAGRNEKQGTAAASVRAGNVIGGGDWSADRIVPDIMRAFSAGKSVSVRNPRAVRPWQFVLEPLYGYLLLAERLWHQGPKFSGAWNFGPDQEHAQPVSWIVDRLQGLWNMREPWELDTKSHPQETQYLKLDSSKARALLGWSTKLDLSTTLQWVANWYRAYDQKKDMRHFTEAQMEEFESVISSGELLTAGTEVFS
ncbi:MAG: CDP-glucose 4,6-dehydratase, partial [Thermodesulfovibrio sp.]|nr:CDP-glucose 4,6-dehydratase [Thermodesulfovibrio sp.]